MKRSSVVAIAAGVALLTVAGCTSSHTGTNTGGKTQDGGKITMAIESDPGKINPITNATQAGQEVAAFTYESLLSFAQDKQPIGGLADSWEITTTQAVFTLKKGIICSDGTPMKASDVAATFAYAAEPATGSPYKGVFLPRERAEGDAG